MRFDNPIQTAPELESLRNQFLKVPRSSHNFSCSKNFNAWFGVLMPIDHIYTLPNEDYELEYDLILENINPLLRNLKSSCSIYVHAYYCRDSQLWEGAENFYTRGRDGSEDLEKPYFNGIAIYKNESSYLGRSTFDVLSLSDFLGIPVNYYHNGSDASNMSPTLPQLLDLSSSARSVPNRNSLSNIKIDALPFAMYQSIFLNYYLNLNLVQNNKKLVPPNMHHWILPYEATKVEWFTYEKQNEPGDTPIFYYADLNAFKPDGEFYVPTHSSNLPLHLGAIHYRQFKGDYFYSSSPFEDIVRGSVPKIDLASAVVDASDVIASTSVDGTLLTPIGLESTKKQLMAGKVDSTLYNPRLSESAGLLLGDRSLNDEIKDTLEKLKVNVQASLQLKNLRALEAYTIFSERMARTSGSYNEMIQAQFGYNPHSLELKPTYIGGFFQNVDISSVTQTSPDNGASGASSAGVGSLAGKAISAGRNRIGHFHSPDFGQIMVIASIVPDLYYTQGIDRNLTKISQSETYFPLLENLSPQAILNKELFVSGTASTDENGFSWTELFSEYKSRQNRDYGLISASDGSTFALDNGAYTLARRFKTTPQFNNQFQTMSPGNIPRNIFTSADDVPFILTVNCNVKKTTCMSYITQPGGLSSRIN